MRIGMRWVVGAVAAGVTVAAGASAARAQAPVAAATASACQAVTFDRSRYTACTFDRATSDVRMFLETPDGDPYLTFAALASNLAAQGATLVFAINGGMYQEDHSPVGLYVEGAAERHKVNTASVGGNPVPNFYKKPNGVFFITATGAGVLTTEQFVAQHPKVQYATQSGPMLVIDGKLHPSFIANSTDKTARDGVCVAGTTRIVFAISEDPVNFASFARFFRDQIGCTNALFLDGGSAPGIYAPDIGRNDPPSHGGYGPIIAVVRKG